MKKKQKNSTSKKSQQTTTLGDFAHQIIAEQFQRITAEEKGVLADRDPEHLHQMRVGTRRLRTVLQIFAGAIQLPKVASAKQLRNLAKVLGEVRDLDVQMASLAKDYAPDLNKREQKQLNQVVKSLNQSRETALETMQKVLRQPAYQTLKAAYEDWIDQPQYQPLAALPLSALLPDLLSPLLSKLLLHPGWLIPTAQVGDANVDMLHELRKVCKHVRYQAEFFVPLYEEEFESWIKELKGLQDDLGALQDVQVLRGMLDSTLGKNLDMPKMQALIQQKQAASLSNWEDLRQKYLDEGFRYHLHQMLLQPKTQSAKVHPELVGSN